MFILNYGVLGKVHADKWPPVGHCFPLVSFKDAIFMPPTLKKLEGHIGLGLSVCLCVRV